MHSKNGFCNPRVGFSDSGPQMTTTASNDPRAIRTLVDECIALLALVERENHLSRFVDYSDKCVFW